ncbi:hypothetical protein Bbelb_093030 [Branchiostoma belcheri]|nr:hypothetical protein Bbelb_093030 [Branchiostoma belcheri]
MERSGKLPAAGSHDAWPARAQRARQSGVTPTKAETGPRPLVGRQEGSKYKEPCSVTKRMAPRLRRLTQLDTLTPCPKEVADRGLSSGQFGKLSVMNSKILSNDGTIDADKNTDLQCSACDRPVDNCLLSVM